MKPASVDAFVQVVLADHAGDWSWAKIDTLVRLLSRVRVNDETGCWEFVGGRNRSGYGQIGGGGQGRQKASMAHRASYELLRDTIPPGLVLDHLCRVKCCINPAHLEPVTSTENIRRGHNHERAKTHCPQGHPYDAENTRVVASTGHRKCRICTKEAKRRHYRKSVGGVVLPPAGERTHCPHGHAYTPENTYVTPKGDRQCRECKRDAVRRYQRRHRGGAIPVV